MSNGRARIARRIAAGASVSALVLTFGVHSTSYADPSIDEVEDRVGTLYHEAEIAQERLNDIRSKMGGKTDRLRSLERALSAQRDEVEEIGDVVAGTIADQAQGASFGPTGDLLFAEDPEEFLDGLAASEAFNRHQGEMITELETESEKLELREQQVESELAELAADQKQMAAEAETVEAKLAQAKDLLAELKAEERERLRIEHAAEAAEQRKAEQREAEQREAEQREAAPSRSQGRGTIEDVPASGRGSAAVSFAMGQVGDAYVYGAMGPDAWDCSGLTMGAWAAAGVSLPHSSSAQMGSGTSVSESQLQPGDLVFYYSPVSHVGMYIGDGQVVHAANPSSGVNVTSLHSMPFSGAVRPG